MTTLNDLIDSIQSGYRGMVQHPDSGRYVVSSVLTDVAEQGATHILMKDGTAVPLDGGEPVQDRDLERISTLKGAMMAEALLDEVAKERDALRKRLAEVVTAGSELAQWANRMPDDWITTDDPRLSWWYERPIARWEELTDEAPMGEDVR